MTKAVWYGPNLHRDLSQLVSRASEWVDVWGPNGVQCVILHPEVFLWGPAEVAAGSAPNDVFTPAKESGLLPKLREWGLPLVSGLGVIKPGQPESLNGTFSRDVQLPILLERIAACGGELSGIVIDEPLTGWRAFAEPAGYPYQRAVDATAEFVQECDRRGLGCGLIEAYPFNTATAIADFTDQVAAKLGHSLGLIVDADHLYQIGTRPCGFLGLRRCPVYISRETIKADLNYLQYTRGLPLSVFIIGFGSDTDAEYTVECNGLVQDYKAAERCLIVQSWREVPSANNRQLPTDLPTHVDIVRAALSVSSDRERPPKPGTSPPPPPPARDVWIGATAFRLPQLQMAGVDIRPYLEQYKACGFNILRCFGMKYPNTAAHWALDPKGRPLDHYFSSDLPRFFDTLASFGLRCEWNALIDTRYLMPDHNEQQEFEDRTVEGFRPYGWPYSRGNEVTNGDWQTINQSAFRDPVGVFWCRGSSETDKTPVKPFGSYATYGVKRMFHDRDGRAAGQYSPTNFEEDAFWQPVPFIGAEGEKPQNYGFDPRFAELMGVHARIGNGHAVRGGFFHYPEGIDGQLMPANVEACARAFVRGLVD